MTLVWTGHLQFLNLCICARHFETFTISLDNGPFKSKVWNFGNYWQNIVDISCIGMGRYDITIEILNERRFPNFDIYWFFLPIFWEFPDIFYHSMWWKGAIPHGQRVLHLLVNTVKPKIVIEKGFKPTLKGWNWTWATTRATRLLFIYMQNINILKPPRQLDFFLYIYRTLIY